MVDLGAELALNQTAASDTQEENRNVGLYKGIYAAKVPAVKPIQELGVMGIIA